MRRAIAAIASTAAGIGAVLALHGRSTPVISTNGQTLLPSATIPSTSPPSTSSPPSGSTSPTTTAPPTATTSSTGENVQYGYGVLAVRVTVSGGKISNLSMANLQTAESYSQSIAQQVIPILRNEVLSAQSAQVNGISGATYTSEAYLQSVQSALDHLRG